MQTDYSVDIVESIVDEELVNKWGYKSPPLPIDVCKCVIGDEPIEPVYISPRKQLILSTVSRTEEYLRERRIPELIRFLLTKVISNGSPQPVYFLEALLDDCMLFRAGHGQAPVLYEDRHLQAVVKSFDPGNRGWLSSGQVIRAFTTLGITPPTNLQDRIAVDEVLNNLKETQENELFKLLSAGTDMSVIDEDESEIKDSQSNSDSNAI